MASHPSCLLSLENVEAISSCLRILICHVQLWSQQCLWNGLGWCLSGSKLSMAADLKAMVAQGSHPISHMYGRYYYACLSDSTQMSHLLRILGLMTAVTAVEL